MLSGHFNGSDANSVFLRDALPERAALVTHLINGVDSDTAVQELGPSVRLPGGAVVILGLAFDGDESGELQRIQDLTAHHSVVVCYAAQNGGISLGARCSVLLAGARDLLDAGDDNFGAQLRAAVSEVCREQKARESEHARLVSFMRILGAVGESVSMFDVIRSAERIGQFSELPVLITGETGTGKELIASAIHMGDARRRTGPLIPVNCGALDVELSGSELFGHRKGAYTGAAQDRPGLFRAAEGGVLFLDEIGELATPLQAKLLRVLQSRRVLALGDDCETDVDVRVVAATNRDLRAMVTEGTFREDLFHRLNVTAIHIPPLRERREDIAPLVAHFLNMHAAERWGPEVRACSDFIHALEAAELPGNARQVENLVCHALVRRTSPNCVSLRDLPDEFIRELSAAAAQRRGPGVSQVRVPLDVADCLDRNGWNLSRSLTHVESLMVQTALAAASGNQSEAARRLGITPRSIYNKLHRSA